MPVAFKELAKWVRSRKGQIICCENEEGKWLPFKSLIYQRQQNGHHHIEMIFWK